MPARGGRGRISAVPFTFFAGRSTSLSVRLLPRLRDHMEGCSCCCFLSFGQAAGPAIVRRHRRSTFAHNVLSENLESRWVMAAPAAPVIIEPFTEGQITGTFDINLQTDPGSIRRRRACLAVDGVADPRAGQRPDRVADRRSCRPAAALYRVDFSDGAFVGSLAGRTELNYSTNYQAGRALPRRQQRGERRGGARLHHRRGEPAGARRGHVAGAARLRRRAGADGLAAAGQHRVRAQPRAESRPTRSTTSPSCTARSRSSAATARCSTSPPACWTTTRRARSPAPASKA